MADARGQRTRSAYGIRAVIVAVGVIASSNLTFHLPANSAVAASYGASVQAMAWATSLYLVASVAVQVAAGHLADRLDGQRLIVACLVTATMGSAWCAAAPGMDTFTLGRMAQCAAAGALVVTRVMIGRSMDPDDAVAAQGLLMATTAAGAVVMPLLGAIIAGSYGWRATFAVAVMLGIAGSAIVSAGLRPDRPENPEPPARLDEEGRLEPVAWVTFATACLSVSTYQAMLVLVPMLFAHEEDAASLTGWALSLASFGFVLSSFSTRFLTDALGSVGLIIAGRLVCIAASALLMASGASAEALVAVTVLALFAIGVGDGLTIPSAIAETMQLARRSAGLLSGLFGAASVLVGVAVSNAVVGVAEDAADPYWPVALALAIPISLSFLAALLAIRPR